MIPLIQLNRNSLMSHLTRNHPTLLGTRHIYFPFPSLSLTFSYPFLPFPSFPFPFNFLFIASHTRVDNIFTEKKLPRFTYEIQLMPAFNIHIYIYWCKLSPTSSFNTIRKPYISQLHETHAICILSLTHCCQLSPVRRDCFLSTVPTLPRGYKRGLWVYQATPV